MEIKIHSISDLITNSSTEIYCCATNKSKQYLTEFIDLILKESGLDKKCDDLFEIRVVTSEQKCYEDTGSIIIKTKSGIEKNILELIENIAPPMEISH